MLNELFLKLFHKAGRSTARFPRVFGSKSLAWLAVLPLFSFFTPFLYGQSCGSTQCPLPVATASSDTLFIDVNGAVKNSLTDSTQGLCSVSLNFKSPYIWGNRVLLISPAGQTVTLTGPVLNRLSSTGFSQWNISFVRSSAVAAPDPGFANRWTNNQDWAGLSTYAGSYYPSQGKLENYNAGTVNGRWTLIFSNQSNFYVDTLLDVALNFCDASGIGCNNKKCSTANDLYKNICGGSFQSGDKRYAESGVYRDTVTGAFGCDSITILHLTIRPAPVTEIGATICQSDSFLFNGVYLTKTGKYDRVFPAANGCDSIVRLTLQVVPLTQQIVSATICEGGSVSIGKNQYASTGTFIVPLKTSSGCDSSIELHLKVIPRVYKNIKDSICPGQVYRVGVFVHSVPGTYIDTLHRQNGCDSVVLLELSFKNCTIKTSLAVRDVDCAGADNGVLYLSAWGTTAPYRYTWLNKTSAEKGGGVIAKENGTDTARGLLPGKYLINIDDALGNHQSASASVSEPEPLNAKVSGVSASGKFNLSCADSKTGYADALITGGIAPYQISWDAGLNNPALKNAGAGLHQALVVDARGCRTKTQIVLTAPDPIRYETGISPPVCAGEKNASITVNRAQGGTSPFIYSLDGTATFSTRFTSLKAGSYRLRLKDAAGCVSDSLIRIIDPAPNTIDLGGAREIALGDSFRLTAETNVSENALRQIAWTPDISGGCARCLEFILKPLHTEFYKAVVIDDKGCRASDSVRVIVNGQAPVFIPNIFTPEGNDRNNRLTIFATSAVQEVVTFKVFDRWGGQLFEKNHFTPNNLPDGWDGTRQGTVMESGVYIWMAEYLLIDGTRQTLGGNVTLVR